MFGQMELRRSTQLLTYKVKYDSQNKLTYISLTMTSGKNIMGVAMPEAILMEKVRSFSKMARLSWECGKMD